MTSAPTLFLNPAGHGYVPGEERHLWKHMEGELVAVCSTVNPVNRNANFPQASPSGWRSEDVCEKCLDTEEFEAYKEETLIPDSEKREQTQSDYDIEEIEIEEDEDSPFESLEPGKVLVNRNYVGGGQNERKLHAYEEKELHGTVTYRSYCGRDFLRTPDPLEPMGASIFTGRSSTCKICAENVDPSLDKGDASKVAYDPFGVFETTPAKGAPPDLSLSDIPDEPDEYTCEQCGRAFSSKGLGQHWGHPNSACDYPEPSDYEKELLIGLWLVGGSIENRGTHPVLRKTSTNRLVLEWLRDELGVWGVDVSESQSAESQSQNVEDGFGYEGANSQTQYRLTTRSCPFLESLENRNPVTLPFTETIGRILYSFRGSLHDKSAISFRHKDADLIAHVFHDVGFTETSLYEPDEGKNQYKLVLSAENSRKFAEWIEAPLPGFDNKRFEFREQGPQGIKPSKRIEPYGDVSGGESEETATTSESTEDDSLPETISLEPEWDWVGVQLYKLGLKQMAIRAFNAELSPKEVYGEGGVEDVIYTAYWESDANLDLGAPIEGGLSTVEKPVTESEVKEVKRNLGLLPETPDGNGGAGDAPA